MKVIINMGNEINNKYESSEGTSNETVRTVTFYVRVKIIMIHRP